MIPLWRTVAEESRASRPALAVDVEAREEHFALGWMNVRALKARRLDDTARLASVLVASNPKPFAAERAEEGAASQLRRTRAAATWLPGRGPALPPPAFPVVPAVGAG